MWGSGPRGDNCTCSVLCQISVTSLTNHKQIGPFWCSFLGGWGLVYVLGPLVSPTNSPVRLKVSPAASSTPTGVFSQWFEALFLHTGTLGCVVCPTPQFCLVYLRMNVGPPGPPAAALQAASCFTMHHLTGPTSHNLARPNLPAAALPQVLSTPLTSLYECFFSNYLVVRLPYSSIFCQFWLLLFLNCCPFFWLCKEA
ncbi:hypothetical protein HJG60_012171 [Phyllostomus discolor]|uniref:Uncharacterized protein n=1 Tax=Phyllostomus discolor TaxID=89673 RepID=A0A833ZE12_9CHIR|nr:hypothetical protein HJG60_012171 [Phyllostomus discolor]